mgnify:FL=1
MPTNKNMPERRSREKVSEMRGTAAWSQVVPFKPSLGKTLSPARGEIPCLDTREWKSRG